MADDDYRRIAVTAGVVGLVSAAILSASWALDLDRVENLVLVVPLALLALHLRVASHFQKRRTRDAVRHGEDRLNLVVEAIRDHAIFLLDMNGRVLTWNSAAESLKGYAAHEIVGRHFSTFYAEDAITMGHPVRELEHALSTGRYEEDGWRLRKDGSRFWANVVITTLRDPSGAVQGFVKITRDFTKRRLAEQEILHSQSQLRTALKEREVLLLEVQHRVKNNLQVISSLMNLQARHVGNTAAQEALVECRARLEAIALIHEKLDPSNESAKVPLCDYTRGLAINVFQALGASPDQVKLHLDLESVALAVDRAVSCGLILNEVITNALKHAFPGGRIGGVCIRLRQVDGEVRLMIRDDGIGMPAHIDPASTKSLGMQIVATLVEQLDGSFATHRHGGTTVNVTFPLEAP